MILAGFPRTTCILVHIDWIMTLAFSCLELNPRRSNSWLLFPCSHIWYIILVSRCGFSFLAFLHTPFLRQIAGYPEYIAVNWWVPDGGPCQFPWLLCPSVRLVVSLLSNKTCRGSNVDIDVFLSCFFSFSHACVTLLLIPCCLERSPKIELDGLNLAFRPYGELVRPILGGNLFGTRLLSRRNDSKVRESKYPGLSGLEQHEL